MCVCTPSEGRLIFNWKPWKRICNHEYKAIFVHVDATLTPDSQLYCAAPLCPDLFNSIFYTSMQNTLRENRSMRKKMRTKWQFWHQIPPISIQLCLCGMFETLDLGARQHSLKQPTMFFCFYNHNTVEKSVSNLSAFSPQAARCPGPGTAQTWMICQSWSRISAFALKGSTSWTGRVWSRAGTRVVTPRDTSLTVTAGACYLLQPPRKAVRSWTCPLRWSRTLSL